MKKDRKCFPMEKRRKSTEKQNDNLLEVDLTNITPVEYDGPEIVDLFKVNTNNDMKV